MSDTTADHYARIRASAHQRTTLPSMPWVELLGFLLMIALVTSTGG